MSASPQSRGDRSPVSRMSWYLAAFVLLLSANPYWMSDSAALVAPPGASAMAPADIWNPPAASSESLRALFVWPYWLFALTGGVFFGSGAALASKQMHPLLVSLFLVGFCLAVSPQMLIPAMCVVVVSHGSGTPESPGSWFRLLALPVLAMAAAVLLTLEPGLLLLLIICLWTSHLEFRRRSRGWTSAAGLAIAGVICGIAVATFVRPDFGAVLLRPLSSVGIRFGQRLMPSLASVLTTHPSQWLSFLAATVVLAVWAQRVFGRRATIAGTAGIAILSVIAVASQRYLWPAVLTIMLLHVTTLDRVEIAASTNQSEKLWPFRGTGRIQRLAPFLCLVVGLLLIGRDFAQNGSASLTMNSRDRILDPSKWGIQGRVMLTDLDQAMDWQSPDSREKYELLMDDRWENFSGLLDAYSRAADDWTNWQREAYLRSDVTWGGYRAFFEQWSPDIVVVPSQDLETIRRVSINSDWPLLGIDRRRTMFGRSTNRQCAAQSARALSLLANLECPRADREQSLEGILQLGTSADARAVANVLNAMRLPYAALRVLPEDNHPETELVRTWSYVELAQRCLQNTGRISLLDHSRAMHRLRDLENTQRLFVEDRNRVHRSIDSLRSNDIQATVLQEGAGDDNALTDTSAQIDRFRQAIRNGGPDDVSDSLDAVSNVVLHEFLGLLLPQENLAAAARESRLRTLAGSDGFPAEFVPEASFYLGCLALESGKPVEAAGWFDQCRTADESGPFAPFARYYLRQLVLVSFSSRTRV